MNLSNRSIILIIGTRPEGIKLAPVYFALKKLGLPVKICATFQHTSLLQEVFDLFNIKPDFVFGIMRPNQDLFYITGAVLENCKQLFTQENPSLIIVQGDTTSAMSAALAAFYLKIPVAHVEAGLRTGDIYAPFPEELNRQFISLIAKYNFAPTGMAVDNLKQAGIRHDTIYEVGNTVVDSLKIVLSKIESGDLLIRPELKKIIKNIYSKKIVLFTMHRRESFGDKMVIALSTIKEFAKNHPQVTFIYPMHPNPNVRQAVEQVGLNNCDNIFLIDALPYHELVYLLNLATCVATDSGGIQEEAASLGKPVVLLRSETDRPEAVQAGLAWLAGCDPIKINQYLCHALNLPTPTLTTNIYGDGQSAAKIVEILKKEF